MAVLKVPNAALRFRPPGETAPLDKGGERAPRGGDAAKAGAGGAQAAQLRERLVTELKLTPEQQARLDPVFADVRTQSMNLRELPERERAKAGATMRAEMRTRIEAVLNDEQRERYAQIVAETAGRPITGQFTPGRVYTLVDGRPRAIDVRVGISDGTMSEVVGDGVAEGMDVIVGLQGAGGPAAPAQKGSPPRMFF
jgi:HlyD family secretion protein